jgi:hypothetical protein
MAHIALNRSAAGRVAVLTVGLALLAGPFAPVAEASITSPFRAYLSVQLAPGIRFQAGHMTTSGGRPQQVRVATIEPALPNVKMKALLSNDRVVRREVVSRIAILKRRPGFRPMVATNGDMSTRNRVDAYAAPHSMAVSNGELLVAQACIRPTLGIDADGGVRISDVRADVSMTLPGKPVPQKINRVNTHRDDGAIVLYTPRFGARTQTAAGGVEVVLDLKHRVEANGSQVLTVLKVRHGGGNTRLRPGRAVLSVRNRAHGWVYRLRPGQHLTLNTQIGRKVDRACGGLTEPAPGWGPVVEAQGGNHYTLRPSGIAAPSRREYPQGSERHPRTNVGITADGRVLMVTVDGRRSNSIGVTLAEMGQLMHSLGAVKAFNLDGGGSTDMARYKPGSGFVVANHPSDGRERPATQALAVFTVAAPS